MSTYSIGDKVVFVDRNSSSEGTTCMRLGEVVGGQAYRIEGEENAVWEYSIKGLNDAIFTVGASDII